jgi:hypothetical protein
VIRSPLHVAALLAFWLLYAHYFSLGHVGGWDCETYYYAASAAQHGLDPYNLEKLAAVAKRPVALPFLYPPATLLFFTPLTWMSVSTAVSVWFAIKLALFALLLWLWHKRFLRDTDAIILSMVAALGFNAAPLWDLRGGNVAILESLLLWWAFVCYVEERRTAFAALVVLASVFKIVPILFLVLLLVPSKREPARPILALGGGAALAAFVLLPVLFGPPWASNFLRPAASVRPTGVVNPCALGIFDTLLGSGRPESLGPAYLPVLLWAAYCVTLAGLSWPAVKMAWDARNPLRCVLVSVFLFVLLSPRPMIYSYLMLVPPVMALATPILKRFGGQFLLAALLIAPVLARRFGLIPASFLADNSPFFLALGIWVLYVVTGGGRASRSSQSPPTS